jgi:ribonuclease BN (tRNA processing enzyme)
VLLIRDAQRGEDGLLRTAKPFRDDPVRHLRPTDLRSYSAVDADPAICPTVRVGTAFATLVNGVFGDPLLHIRLQHQRRSLLFDLGEGRRLPGRIAHQISDVFISHAHIDHIGGFLWLLRSRLGQQLPPCRVYGPAGIAGHLAGMLSGIRWDRIGADGPRFEIAELHGDRLCRFAIQAGCDAIETGPVTPVSDGLIVDEPLLRVRVAVLDHGIPVLAFALQQPRRFNVRKDRLHARGLPAGPWLAQLKQHIACADYEAQLVLPDGNRATVAELADDLLLMSPGQTLVYATDLADNAANRSKLTTLAANAQVLFCEAGFLDRDAEQARNTGHLTARACGEIASAAGVMRLIPFHFSRRYMEEPERVYGEVRASCAQVVLAK